MNWRHSRTQGHVKQSNGWVAKTVYRADRPARDCERCGGPINVGELYTRGSGERGYAHSLFCVRCQPAHSSPYVSGHMQKGTPASIDEALFQEGCPLCERDRFWVADFNDRIGKHEQEWVTCPHCAGSGKVRKAPGLSEGNER